MGALIALIDYGIGNVGSVEKALRYIGADAHLTRDPEVIAAAGGIVFPGVGAFGDGIEAVRRLGLEKPILDAIAAGKPFLGICLGMQLLFEASEEMGHHEGLGVFRGRVVRFPSEPPTGSEAAGGSGGLKVPQIGWNQVRFRSSLSDEARRLLEGIPDASYFYFVHGYYCRPDEPGIVIATTDYGIEYPSIVGRGRVFGVQFHPEKSQKVGLRLLSNFVRMCGVSGN